MDLTSFPDERTNQKSFKDFLDAAAEAGIYLIAFAKCQDINPEDKNINHILKSYPRLEFYNDSINLNNIEDIQNFIKKQGLKIQAYKKQDETKLINNIIADMSKRADEII